MKIALTGACLAALAAVAACSSSQPTAAPATSSPASAAIQSAAASASASPVSAVPGSNDNEYVTGPFTVTLKGIGPLPTQYDAVTQQGNVIPENCAVVDVRNTSSSFAGWVAPQVEFVKGHSLKGQVLGTDAADPSGGSSGGSSDTLAPGQSERLYACPQGISGSVYVEAQLISVTYGTPGEGTLSGTTLQLRY